MSITASAYSIFLSVQYGRKVRESISKRKHGFHPPVCLILPCKGDEVGLQRNIEAALHQEYEDYHLIVVTDSAEDPAYQIAKAAFAGYPKRESWLCTSNGSPAASGKVAALLTAIAYDKRRSEVYAFLDSDALVSSTWLKDLVDPLEDESVGATTGFRWHFPLRRSFGSNVEEEWNAAGTNLLFSDRYNFPWGGAMAIRARTLDRINISQVWSRAISDDLSLNIALKSHGYKIRFLPQCTVATFNDSDFRGFLDWATRQTTLTKVYHNSLWRYGLLAYSFFNLTFLLGIFSAALGVILGPTWFWPSALLLSLTALSPLGSAHRNSAFSRAMPQFKEEFENALCKRAIATLIVPWIMTYCIIKSSRTREIEWRGRTYKLATP